MAVIGGGGGGIKSIQRGSTSVTKNSTATATINAVDVAKSFISSSCKNGRHLRYWVYVYGIGTWNDAGSVGATLTNTTTLTFAASYGGADGNATQGTTVEAIIYWEVIEYE